MLKNAGDVVAPIHVVGPNDQGFPHLEFFLLPISIVPTIHQLDLLSGLHVVLVVSLSTRIFLS